MSRLMFENPDYVKEILIADTISILKGLAANRMIPRKYVIVCRSVLKDNLILSQSEVVNIKGYLYDSITITNGEPHFNAVHFFISPAVNTIKSRIWSILVKEVPALSSDLKLYGRTHVAK